MTLLYVIRHFDTSSEIAKFVFSELIGAFAMVFFGNGTVACFELKKTKGSKGVGGLSWLGVGFGYGFGVFVGVIMSDFSDHEINPAATIFDSILTLFHHDTIFTHNLWLVPVAFASQLVGAMLSQLVLDIIFWISFKETDDPATIINMHSTVKPSHTDKEKLWFIYLIGFITETIGTTLLLFACKFPTYFHSPNAPGESLYSGTWEYGITAGIVVLLLVISLGGVTGPALNPARDLGPRIMYSIMRIPNKDKKLAEWDYAWVPVLGPVTGAVLAALITQGFMSM